MGCWVFGLLCCWVVGLLGFWVLGFLGGWVVFWLLACWVAGFLDCCVVVALLGSWVVGLLGCWVIGLLGFWVVKFLGGWVVFSYPTQRRQKKQKGQQRQKRQPCHPQPNRYGPAECAKRLNPPPLGRRLKPHSHLSVPGRVSLPYPPAGRAHSVGRAPSAPSGAIRTPFPTRFFLFELWCHMWTA